MSCERWNAPDVELYFYGELEEEARACVEAHLHTCAACRQRVDDLRAIRRALAARPSVDAPAAGDWSGFMRRLDQAVGVGTAHPPPTAAPRRGVSVLRHVVAFAAVLALVATGLFIAARVRSHQPAPVVAATPQPAVAGAADAGVVAKAGLTPDAALREVSAEHLEKSKLVVLGLAARDPRTTRPSDWQYERKLAGTLLPDTRLYRLAAQEHGAEDVAHVMRDLETVLLEASMSDADDRDSLGRVQRLIARRGLVTRMQVVATSAGL